MADDTNIENGLPPKLDLRHKGFTSLNAQPAVLASAPTAGDAVTPASPAVPSPTQESTPNSSDASRGTMRITLPDIPQAAAAKPTLPTFMRPEGASQAANQPATDSVQGEPAAAPAPGTPGSRPLMRPTMAPKTIKLKKPIPLGIRRDTPDPAAPPDSKRTTSKISLPSDPDTQETATPGIPQPIRIAPAMPAATVSTEAGSGESDIGDAPAAAIPVVPPQPVPDPKRQTSRISLDAVLGNEGESGGPKTIKLKRPSSSTIRVQGMESPVATDSSRKTSSVELPSDTASDDDAPATQKKTIKVKRPSARPSLRTGGSGGSATGGGSAPTMFAPPAKALASADSAHWFFILTGCAATISIAVLIYVLCAQILGPNISLTELSYGAPDAELPWPGRITR